MANQFISYLAKDVGTSATTLLTVPVLTETTAIGMTIANTSASPIKVSVYITRSAVDYFLVKNADVPVGGSLVPLGGEQKVVLVANDALKVVSSTNTSVDVVLSVLNITP